MAQELLNHTQIGPHLEQMGREGVSEGVRADLPLNTTQGSVFVNDALDGPRGNPLPAASEKKWPVFRGKGTSRQTTSRKILPERDFRLLTEKG